MDNISIEQLIYEETEQRLKEMQAPDYQFPERIGKADVAAIVAAAALSLSMIILCMTGVIV